MKSSRPTMRTILQATSMTLIAGLFIGLVQAQDYAGVMMDFDAYHDETMVSIGDPAIAPETYNKPRHNTPAPTRAEFPGGAFAYGTYLKTNLHADGITAPQGNSATVEVTFTVDTDGSIANIQLVNPTDPETDAAVLDVIQQMPSWIPATENGRAISSVVKLPIKVGTKK